MSSRSWSALSRQWGELKEGSESSFSVISPTGLQYQELVDSQVNSLLENYCGLVDAGGRRGIAESDPASGDMERDARFSMKLASEWAPPAFNPQFTVYGNHTAYGRHFGWWPAT